MLISVIIPTFNRPKLVARSINSILNQTIKDIEIIVVDGSEDNVTNKVVVGLNDERINYRKVINRSASNSRNVGLNIAKGEYIAFNDDDDIWNRTKAERQIEIIQDNKINIVYSAFTKSIQGEERVTPGKNVKKKYGQIYNDLLLYNFIGLPTLMAHKRCFEGIFFDDKLYCLEDWDLILRLAKTYSFGFISDSLVTVGDTPKSVNKSNRLVKAISYKRIYQKYYDDIVGKKNIKAKHLLGIGSNYCLANKLSEGRKYLIKSMRAKPSDPTAFACLLISFLGTKMYCTAFDAFERITRRRP